MSSINLESVYLNFLIKKEVSIKEKFLDSILKRSTNNSHHAVLKNINISINEGDRLGIIGSNGAGKSTLLRVLSEIYKPTSGNVKVHGKVIPLLELGAGFLPEFTGRENIYFNCSVLGLNKDYIEKIEKEIISFSEIEDHIDVPVKYYSTGMYMRLAFSIASSITPDILLLDEVFAGGDMHFNKKASVKMNEIINNSNIMIMVSHDMHLIKNSCNKAIWMNHGEIISSGDTDTVINNYIRYSEANNKI